MACEQVKNEGMVQTYKPLIVEQVDRIESTLAINFSIALLTVEKGIEGWNQQSHSKEHQLTYSGNTLELMLKFEETG